MTEPICGGVELLLVVELVLVMLVILGLVILVMPVVVIWVLALLVVLGLVVIVLVVPVLLVVALEPKTTGYDRISNLLLLMGLMDLVWNILLYRVGQLVRR
jgi:hypothetical protein